MKKNIIILAVFGLITACSGGSKETKEEPQVDQEQIEAIEQSTQEVDALMDSSTKEVDSVQNEIDELFKEI